MDQYKTMFEAAVKALAEIDYALGIGADGYCDQRNLDHLLWTEMCRCF